MRLPPNDDLTPDPPHWWVTEAEMEFEIVEAVKRAMTKSEKEQLYDYMTYEGWI